jgi:energy-converting hydrogenase Eha subunit E
VTVLSVLTLGAYVPIWFGLTWDELRRESGDARMQPLGHALSTLLPGWNAWIALGHFRRIDGLLEKADRPFRVDATSAAIGVVIWWLTFTHYSSEPLFLALDAIELVAGTAVVVYGQRALNAFWETRGAEERVLETDLMAIGVAIVYSLFTLVSFFSTTP